MMQAASHNFLALLPNLGGGELLILFFIVLLLFGAKRLPDLARGMGKAMHEFKKATNGIEDEVRSAMDTETPPKKTEPKPEAPSVAEATSPAAAESKQAVPEKPAVDTERKQENVNKV